MQLAEYTNPTSAEPSPGTPGAPKTVLAPHINKYVPIPPRHNIPADKECKYNGEADDLHAPCQGKWKPWKDFGFHIDAKDGLQDVCKLCGALRQRNLRKRMKEQDALAEVPAIKPKRRVPHMKQDVAEGTSSQTATKLTPSVPSSPPVSSVTLSSPMPPEMPTTDEFRRVGDYLLNHLHAGREKFVRMAEILEEQKATIVALETRVAELVAQHLDTTELTKLRESEHTALELAQQGETLAKGLSVRVDELEQVIQGQKSYHKKLISTGVRVPPRYRLLTDEETRAAEESED